MVYGAVPYLCISDIPYIICIWYIYSSTGTYCICHILYVRTVYIQYVPKTTTTEWNNNKTKPSAELIIKHTTNE